MKIRLKRKAAPRPVVREQEQPNDPLILAAENFRQRRSGKDWKGLTEALSKPDFDPTKILTKD